MAKKYAGIEWLVLAAFVIGIIYFIIRIIAAIISAISYFFIAIFKGIAFLFLFLWDAKIYIFLIFLFILGIVLFVKFLNKNNTKSLKCPILRNIKLKNALFFDKNIFYDALSDLIENHGEKLLYKANLQKCRGLLKDCLGDECSSEISILCDILSKDIFSSIKNTNIDIIPMANSLYSKHYSQHDKNRNNIYTMVQIVLSILIRKNILKENKNKIEIVKKVSISIIFHIEYFISYLFFIVRSKYEKILPITLVVSSLICFVIVCFVQGASSFNNISPDNISKKNIQKTPKEIARYEEPAQPHYIPVYKYVNVSVLNLRQGPSSSAQILTQLSQNAKIEIISSVGAWSQIKYNSYTGYVNSKYIGDSPVVVPQRTTTTSGPILKLAEPEIKEKD